MTKTELKDPQTRKALKSEIRNILVKYARRGETITYKQLVEQVQTYRMHWQCKTLDETLVDISADENAAGRGMLSVVVIHSGGDRLPGLRFFAQAKELGRSGKSEREIWDLEVQAVQNFWKER
jgi:hypothetical protein